MSEVEASELSESEIENYENRVKELIKENQEMRAILSKTNSVLIDPSILKDSTFLGENAVERKASDLRIENSKLKKEIAAQEAKNAELTVKIVNLEAQGVDSTNQIEELQGTIGQRNATIEQQQQKIAELTSMYQDIYNKFIEGEAVVERMKKEQRKIQIMEAQIKEKDEKIASLERDTSMISLLKANIASYEQQIEVLKRSETSNDDLMIELQRQRLIAKSNTDLLCYRQRLEEIYLLYPNSRYSMDDILHNDVMFHDYLRDTHSNNILEVLKSSIDEMKTEMVNEHREFMESLRN